MSTAAEGKKIIISIVILPQDDFLTFPQNEFLTEVMQYKFPLKLRLWSKAFERLSF